MLMLLILIIIVLGILFGIRKVYSKNKKRDSLDSFLDEE